MTYSSIFLSCQFWKYEIVFLMLWKEQMFGTSVRSSSLSYTYWHVGLNNTENLRCWKISGRKYRLQEIWAVMFTLIIIIINPGCYHSYSCLWVKWQPGSMQMGTAIHAHYPFTATPVFIVDIWLASFMIFTLMSRVKIILFMVKYHRAGDIQGTYRNIRSPQTAL